MATVREQALELLRARGMTTIFGNPGSTELPMLAGLPEDFTYVLGLQELVVVGMADGYAQASGRPAHANLHTGPGVGNAMGGILNAAANRSPLLVTAGQQARAQTTIEATLTNRDAIVLTAPHVKYSHEPARAQDVPTALARAIDEASIPPRGPAFVSIPMDDWNAADDPDRSAAAMRRAVHARAAPDPDALADLAARLGRARSPVLVAGPGVDAGGAWDDAVSLAESQRLPVWAAPVTGGSRLGFPEDHPQFRGVLPPAIAPLSQTLAGHDLVLVAGAPVFAYYPYVPGPLLPPGAELVLLTADPTDAARAVAGEAVLGDVGAALRGLAQLAPAPEASARPLPDPRPAPAPVEPAADGERCSAAAALQALAAAWPQDAVAVVESPSSMLEIRDRLRLSRPGSWYFSASGGLGFGIAAAVGVQLADPGRPVVAILGEGSAQYGITALWTAVTYEVPVTFVVLRNDQYAILKWFAAVTSPGGPSSQAPDGETPSLPGLDLPGLDTAAIARAYGMEARDVATPDELAAALREPHDGPRLLQIAIA